MNRTLHRQRGAVAIMVAVSMIVLLAAVGLALDAGLAYLVKARLNAAVDSAALAGARAVTAGNNQAEQTASARTAAQDFFDANIASGYMGSSPRILSTSVTFQGGRAIIDVTAEAPMAVSIMQVAGFQSLAPVAAAQTVRNDLDMVFVIDTSGSLQPVAATVKSSAKTFLSKFNVTQDRVSMIHFAAGSEIDFPFNAPAGAPARGFNRAAMLKKIDSLSFANGTASMEAMYDARAQLKSITGSNRSSARVIVFFSDGEPTGFASYLDFMKSSDCNDYAGVLDRSGDGLSSLGNTDSAVTRADCLINRNGYVATRSLPAWYNGRNPRTNQNDPLNREFPIVTGAPRQVTADIASNAMYIRNVDRAARNLVESVSARAREEGVVVFTLGLGAALKTVGNTGLANDTGENILKCMANVPDAPARCYKPDQPAGMYCYAATEADLTPCFSRLASAILRLTR